MFDYRIMPAGDTALIVEFGEGLDRVLNMRVIALALRFDQARIVGLIETLPTFRSLMICYDPTRLIYSALVGIVKELVDDLTVSEISGHVWHLPVCYDPSVALDIVEVAEHAKLTCAEVVACHTAPMHHVYMLGFLPGQPYLGDLPDGLALPRRKTPRPKIASGSVGIAGKMTCLFPMETPCGLNIIGRTPVSMWDNKRSPQSLLCPGDKVIFDQISLDEYDALSELAANGQLDIQPSGGMSGEAR